MWEPADNQMQSTQSASAEQDFASFLNLQLQLLAKVSHKHHIPDRLYVLRWAAESAELIDGWWAEFGVFQGTSVNMLAQKAKIRRDRRSQSESQSPSQDVLTEPLVFGFDSFEGLPPPESDGRGDWLTKRFDRHGIPPEVEPNVELVPGWFADTLPTFLLRQGIAGRPAALVHIDCDIYSSALCVLTHLTAAGAIVPGTVIVFDELLHYSGYERNELRALHDWAARFTAEWDWICVKDRVMTGAQSLRPEGCHRPHRQLRAQGFDQAAALRVRRVGVLR